ncbi:hypothetical protein IFM89_038917 [Coptis chinensis]|uniref:DUF3444 domain-containing protein n=1 Tax=Coptis chinensis TaxID=261450 RepID=A0A835I838_9MAGN|nr:hypothetical protein IFM89_038917 [Coptis chinensis]
MSNDPRCTHAQLIKTENNDLSLINNLITSYSKSNLLSDALRLFRQIPSPNVVTWMALISSYTNTVFSFHHFISMLRYPKLPNERTFASLFKTRDLFLRYLLVFNFIPFLLNFVSLTYHSLCVRCAVAAAHLAALEQCRIIHAHAFVAGHTEVVVGTALVDGYGKSAYAQQGDVNSAIELFDGMKQRGFVADELSFLAILTACRNAGLVVEAEKWLNCMISEYEVEPGLEHYTCVVGALARAGRLRDAERLTKTMPFTPDAAVCRLLLSACATKIASEMAQKLLEKNSQDDSAYTILVNVHAASKSWDKVADVRKMMKVGRKRAAFDLKRVEGWVSFAALYGREVFDCVVSGQSSSGNKRVCMSELSDGSNGHDVVKKVRLSGDEIKEGGVEVDRIENSTSSQIVNDTMDVKCTKDDRFELVIISQDCLLDMVGLIRRQAELSVTWLKPVPFMEDERRWREAGFPVACGSFELDPDMSEEKVSGTKVFSQICSWVHGVTDEQFVVYPEGEVWAVFEDWNLAEWSSNPEMISGLAFLEEIQLKETDSIYFQTVCTCSLTKFQHSGLKVERWIVEDGMFELDPLALSDYPVIVSSFDEHSSSSISSLNRVPESIPPMRSYSAKSLRLNWCANDFSVAQIWAIYSSNDAMPRRYAIINKVLSNSQVRITVLEPHPVLGYEICWEKENLPIVLRNI